MEIKSFNKLIDNPLELSFQDKVLIQEECVKAPFSAILRLYDTLCSKACNIAADKMSNTRTILLYLPEKNTLAALLGKVKLKDAVSVEQKKTKEEPQREPDAPQEAAKQVEAQPSEQPLCEQPDCDILKEINDYQEVSFKTAPKSVILDKFLEVAAYKGDDSSPIEPVAVSESGKKSLQPNNSLNTETLAIILVQQGKLDKAVEVYTSLSAQYPEKSATFAVRIEEIKKKSAQAQ